jgi:hypothetical protein
VHGIIIIIIIIIILLKILGIAKNVFLCPQKTQDYSIIINYGAAPGVGPVGCFARHL